MANVSLVDVEKRFGAHVVIPQLNLEIADGSFVVLVGPSGCGKTTTLNMIAGLETITAGQLLIGGRDVTDVPPKARDIAMVFQSYALFPHMTVFDNIAFGMKIRRQAKKRNRLAGSQRRRPAADRTRCLTGCRRLFRADSDNASRWLARLCAAPASFSWTSRCRTSTRSCVSRREASSTKMHHEIGVTTVYVTHDQSEAMTMGDTVVVMKDGVIQQAASPLEVYNKPANTFVAGFIGSPAMNFLELAIDGSKLIDPDNGFAIATPDRLRRALSAYRKAQGGARLAARGVTSRPAQCRFARRPASFHRRRCNTSGTKRCSMLRADRTGSSRGSSASDDSRIGEKRPFLFDPEHMHLFDSETGASLPLGSG